MLSIPGYQLGEEIYKGERTRILRGRRVSDQIPVLVKTFAGDYPDPNDLGRLKHEYEVTRKVTSEGIVAALELCRTDRGIAIIFPDNGGLSVKDLLRQESTGLPLELVFPIAISLVKTLEAIHRAGVIHKDINPANIILPETREPDSLPVRIINFSLATLLSHDSAEIISVDKLQGTLAYISPEQTGRMNRDVDYRSDFYSLGVTLFEIATGLPPFRTGDPMGLIHSHIAREPEPPHQMRPLVPVSLSRVILKLMAKNPEDRYQSARGILSDLEEIQNKSDNIANATPSNENVLLNGRHLTSPST